VIKSTTFKSKRTPPPGAADEDEMVCGEIRRGWCAALANGRARCPAGWCANSAPDGPHEWEPGAPDRQARVRCRACRELWEHPWHEPSRRRPA